MNRLILIGNGFDLAHGLKTSYKDFIEYLWKGIFVEIIEVKDHSPKFEDCRMLIRVNVYSEYAGANSVRSSINRYLKHEHSKELQDIVSQPSTEIIKTVIAIMEMIGISYVNYFFKIISQNYINKNWSDIEADYYKELLRVKNNQEDINELNKQFKQIKELLKDYLKDQKQPKKIDRLESLIYAPIEFDDLKLGYNPYPINNIGLFPNFNSVVKDSVTYLNNRLLGSSMFLNFNYTKTENLYVKKNIQVNHIHGSLGDSSNHIIFGYGDEEADEYKELEKLDYKGILDNVKSINYLEASNYRDMKRFIESAPYQIFIMGMSCGMADHTMLHKLFQHKNCVSVKPFYYQWKDDKGNIAGDNYTEIVQNISRCFSDKDLLRSVVVNKPNCEPLPQHDDK